ncbi:MAG: inorganic phosphate transporter, partial [Dehalococcoidales bacterium]|nr:inorganic phosphate transporter [Dehalococcoidales bacterium]
MPDIALLLPLLPVLFLVLAAEFVNGWTDSPNAIATVVSTRVLSPGQAVIMASVLNIVGALVTGTAVATTIGEGIVKPEFISLPVVAAAMLTILAWSAVTYFYAIPSSKSHELIASLSGAGLAAAGPSVLLWEGWQKVLIGLGFSTILGFCFGMIVMTLLYWLLRGTSLASIRGTFSRLQILSSAFMAFSHGSNDGQKFMGVFALALVLGGAMAHFTVPWWVMLLCGMVMGLGTVVGGWRIMRTLG